jgi:hypothetical protein
MILVDSVDGIKQVINQVYNRCPAEYSMPSELLNLAVGSFLLTKGVMFGKFDTVKFSRVSYFQICFKIFLEASS